MTTFFLLLISLQTHANFINYEKQLYRTYRCELTESHDQYAKENFAQVLDIFLPPKISLDDQRVEGTVMLISDRTDSFGVRSQNQILVNVFLKKSDSQWRSMGGITEEILGEFEWPKLKLAYGYGSADYVCKRVRKSFGEP